MNKNLTLGLCALVLCLAAVFAFQSAAAPAAPAGLTGTPNFLPLILRQNTPTPTATVTPTDTPVATLPPTDTPTSTSVPTSTPTETQPPAPASLHITTLSGDTMPEHVDITNSGGTAQDMTGWSLVSVVGPQTFNFPNSYVLGAGQSVSLQSYNGAGNNPPTILFWSSAAIWLNAGDKAELRDNTNALIDSSCYGNAC